MFRYGYRNRVDIDIGSSHASAHSTVTVTDGTLLLGFGLGPAQNDALIKALFLDPIGSLVSSVLVMCNV